MELESTLLDLSLRTALFRDVDSRRYADHRRLGNRRIANFLTTARLYRDQGESELKRGFGRNSSVVEQVVEALREIKRDAPHYRAIMALRDHVQHRDLPVKNIKMKTTLDRRFSPPRLQVMIRVLVDYRELVEEAKRYGKSGKEFSSLEMSLEDDRLADAMPPIREYVACVGKLQKTTRSLLDPELTDAEKDLLEADARLRAIVERKPVGLYVAEIDDQGRPNSLEWISGDHSDRRRELIAKNRSFDAVSRTYIASMDIASIEA